MCYEHQKIEIKPLLQPFSLLSVCGNVFATSYKSRMVSLFFGCPESRKHGGINSSEVVLGIPGELAGRIINAA